MTEIADKYVQCCESLTNTNVIIKKIRESKNILEQQLIDFLQSSGTGAIKASDGTILTLRESESKGPINGEYIEDSLAVFTRKHNPSNTPDFAFQAAKFIAEDNRPITTQLKLRKQKPKK